MQHQDVMFRGKPLDSLSRDEALDALYTALTELKKYHEPSVVLARTETQKAPHRANRAGQVVEQKCVGWMP